MTKENFPLELLNKHRAALGLRNPAVFDGDNALFEHGDKLAESAVVFLPKSKPLIDMTLALVSGMVAEDGMVVLAGTNDAGIRSAKDAYEKNIGPVEQKIVGNHSALYVGKNKRLGAGKSLEDFLSYSPLIYKGASLEVAVMPGVFSAGELDFGTKLLLDTIPYDRKNILDIGCGSGVVGAVYKKLSPKSTVTMSDASRLAIFAAQKTIEKNKIEANVVLSDVFSDIKGAFDLVVVNPPFHKGVGTDYSFIERFARDAKRYLEKEGEVYVVANSFLSYQETLERHIGPTEIVVDDKRFRVFRARCR